MRHDHELGVVAELVHEVEEAVPGHVAERSLVDGGIDTDTRKIDSLQKGISYVPDVKTETVDRMVRSGYL
ncbi:hypothetical protein B4Q13_24270 [Lacticaseibacillus rhamnosus]